MAEIRPYRPEDRAPLLRLLAFLPSHYPGADQWLARRLTDVENGRAYCTLASDGNRLQAVMIETPKASHAVKISTLYVAEDCRHLGLAQRLLAHSRARWKQDGIQRIYATIDSLEPALPFYLLLGFSVSGHAKDRYISGHDELVLEWQGPLAS